MAYAVAIESEEHRTLPDAADADADISDAEALVMTDDVVDSSVPSRGVALLLLLGAGGASSAGGLGAGETLQRFEMPFGP